MLGGGERGVAHPLPSSGSGWCSGSSRCRFKLRLELGALSTSLSIMMYYDSRGPFAPKSTPGFLSGFLCLEQPDLEGGLEESLVGLLQCSLRLTCRS